MNRTFVLWGGPFDGFEHTGPKVRPYDDPTITEYVDLEAPAQPLDGTPPGDMPAPHPTVRYWWRANRKRFEWEGIRNAV